MTGSPTYAPIFLGACSIKLAATEYGPIISSAKFTPKVNTAQFGPAMDGSIYNFAGKPTWTLDLTMAQDYTPSSGLANYLLQNQGTPVTAILTPVSGGPVFTATVVLVAGDIGGDAAKVAATTISLPVNGQPVQS